MKHWIEAARLRTLPLALASIFMGSFLASANQTFDLTVFGYLVATTVALQILSNFANDYGDTQNGADLAGRVGPDRAVQTGAISQKGMFNAIIVMSIISLVLGILLLKNSLGSLSGKEFYGFLGLGLLAILAAITYTAGKKPYGYAGLGDLSVFIFFGPVAVLGSYYLMAKHIDWSNLLPATSTGLFAVAVLNINNLRDIVSDTIAGKNTVPVRIGKENGVRYHQSLLVIGWFCALFFTGLHYQGLAQFVFLAVSPLFLKIGLEITAQMPPQVIDSYLKKMALSSLFFTLLFGLGLLLTMNN
jgi:1,4-dihydroxy-2-naphthoate polyprenyltransferase